MGIEATINEDFTRFMWEYRDCMGFTVVGVRQI